MANAREKRQLIFLIVGLSAIMLAAVGITVVILLFTRPQGTQTGGNTPNIDDQQQQIQQEQEQLAKRKKELIAQADYYALTYDYDRAMDTLKTWTDYDKDPELILKINEYQATKDSCVRVDMSEVTNEMDFEEME